MAIHESVQIRKPLPQEQDINAEGEIILTLDENGMTLGENATINVGTSGVIPSEVTVTFHLHAGAVDTYIFTPVSGRWQVAGGVSKISTSGGAGAAVNVRANGTAETPVQGASQFTAPGFDLEEVAPDIHVGQLIANPTIIVPGQSFSLDFSGTLTGLVGTLTLSLRKVG